MKHECKNKAPSLYDRMWQWCDSYVWQWREGVLTTARACVIGRMCWWEEGGLTWSLGPSMLVENIPSEGHPSLNMKSYNSFKWRKILNNWTINEPQSSYFNNPQVSQYTSLSTSKINCGATVNCLPVLLMWSHSGRGRELKQAARVYLFH